MADSACIIELASNAGEFFINSALDDIMIHPRYPTQKILLGNSNSQTPSLTVTSNAIGVFNISPVYSLDVIGDINYTGSLLKNGSLVSTGGGGGGTSNLSSQWSSDVSNVYIGQSSNVGIGVSNPSMPLEVKGDTKISGNLIMNNRFIMSSLQINRRQGNQANITSTSVTGFSNVSDGVIINIGSNTPASAQSLRAIWSNNEIFTVTGEGDVGIGTSNPSSKLHVVGTIYATADVVVTSDIRAKSNIERIIEPLDKIQQLNGYTFNMIEQPPDQTKLTSKYTGLIAQELIKVLPEAIHIDKNDRYSVAYGNIMGLVVESIKALNDKYEKRIDALERRIEQLST
jgi:hypothetical protein